MQVFCIVTHPKKERKAPRSAISSRVCSELRPKCGASQTSVGFAFICSTSHLLLVSSWERAGTIPWLPIRPATNTHRASLIFYNHFHSQTSLRRIANRDRTLKNSLDLNYKKLFPAYTQNELSTDL